MSQDFPFNAQNFGFDISNAYALAKVSSLVYQSFEDDEKTRKNVINQINNWGFTNFYLFDYGSLGEDSQALILADNDKIIVGFRGTEPKEIQDVLTDLKLTQVKRLNGKVHRGFYAAFTVLWSSKIRIWNGEQEISKKPCVKDILAELLTENKRPIFVTGHSLGGAMAVLGAAACGIELKENYQPDIILYTYGQPRVGNDNFNQALSSNLKGFFRLVNNNDIVPRVPIDIVKKSPALEYNHAGQLVYLDTQKKVHLQDLGWWQKTKDRFFGRIQDLGKLGTDGINDHNLNNYIGILKEALNNPKNIISVE